MARDEARTIKVRCATWDQVESFYTQKLKGDTLVVKMPVQPMIGDGVTVALGLPSGLIFAIDGSVTSVGAGDTAGKWPVAMKMHGLTREVRDRLDRLVRDGREGLLSAPAILPTEAAGPLAVGTHSGRGRPRTIPPSVDGAEAVSPDPEPRLEDVILEEQPAFQALEAVHKRLLALPAHEVLGVPFDGDVRAIRTGYFALARQHHPDAYGRYLSPALRRLASELFIHVNRAYDRMREAALRASGVSMPGPAARDGGGWIIDASEVMAAPQEVYIAVNAPVAVAHVAAPAAAPAAAAASAAAAAAATAAAAAAAPAADTVPAAAAAPAADAAPAPLPPPPVELSPRAASAPAASLPSDPPEVAEPPKDLAAQLFDDLPVTADLPFDAYVPASTESANSFANAGRAALAGGSWEEARENFVAALRLDGKNRAVRALYHVASGLFLRARGELEEAQLQLENALRHDPRCPEALRALGRASPDHPAPHPKKRMFDR